MNIEKIRNLTDSELAHQQRELADQLFKLKFQLKMGQTESLKKIRDMRKDIARINTVPARSSLPAATARYRPSRSRRGQAGEGRRRRRSESRQRRRRRPRTKTAATEKK